MEYLLQFQVKADEVYYNGPIKFKLKDMDLILYLNDNTNWISKGKKAHIVVSASSKEDAYNSVWAKMIDFNNRLIFLTGEYIIITHLEFLIYDQTGESKRNVFFRDIKLPGKHELAYHRIIQHFDFFTNKINKTHKKAIQYFNQAILTDLANDQYKSLFLALESLAGEEQVEAHCDDSKCKGLLICSKCQKTKKYPKVTIKRLQDFIDKSNYSNKFGATIFTAKELSDRRSKLSHVARKTKKKRKFETSDYNHHLSLLIRWFLEEKYGIWPGSSVVKSGVVAGDERKFKTNDPAQKFALDIPPLQELKNYNKNTRWII